MKKQFSNNVKVVLLLLLCCAMVFMLCACGGNNDDNIILPTANEIVAARQSVANDNLENYDFKMNLSGTVKIAGNNITANANYDGKYRYNKSTGDLKFKRVTSGILLYDSIEYIYTNGLSKVKLVANERGEIRKSSVVLQQEEGLTLINKPFVAIVNALKENNISGIAKSDKSAYKYMANIALNSSNSDVQTVIDNIANMGTSIDMHDVSFTNIANGVKFYFNIVNEKLTDFTMSADLSFPFKGVPLTIKLTYTQSANSSAISIPSQVGILTTPSAISTEVNTINNAIQALKNSEAYSLDFEAINDFDPGWNIRATVDKYIARLYKNTNEGRVDFNHSYEYKAHTEEDGAETFKYTLANIQDGSVHKVSRKGKNSIKEANGVSVNTQFDYLMGAASISADKIDCIRKESSGGSTKYYVYMNKEQTMSVQRIISDIINSNKVEGVIPVDNYFNAAKNIIRDAELVIEMQGGKIVAIDIATKIRYNPTGGDYVEEQITLTNSISIKVDKKLDAAKGYKAPKGTDTVLGSFGLNNAKFYIL